MKPIRATEFSIYIDQRPGELAGVLEAAASAGAEVTAVSVTEQNGRGLVRLLGSPVEVLRRVCEALMDSGIGPIVESEVIAVETEGRPNALRDLATALADERVNVRYAYLSPSRGGRPESFVIRVDELDEVVKKVADLDWPRTNGTA